MKKGKRLLAGLLTAVMVFTSTGFKDMSFVKAATADFSQEIKVSGTLGGSGDQGTDDAQTIVAAYYDGDQPPENGSATSAAYVAWTTCRGNVDKADSARIGCLQFELPENLIKDNIQTATVTLNVVSMQKAECTNTSNSGTNNFTKLALYQTDNSGEVNPADDATYYAKNNDYKLAAASWGDKKLISSATVAIPNDTIISGKVTFDVKEALKNACDAESGIMTLRVMAPKGMVYISNEQSQGNEPELTIDASKANVSIAYVDESNAKIRDDKVLPEQQTIGQSYTYIVPEDEKVIKTETGVYGYDEGSQTSITVADTGNVVTLKYTKASPVSVSSPSTIYVIEGNAPVLPKQLPADTQIQGITAPVDVVWENVSEWKVGDNTVKGTVKELADAQVTAKVHVYECDQDYLIPNTANGVYTADGDANYNNSSPGVMYQFGKKYKGRIITEFDLKTTRKTNDNDKAIIYLDSQQETGAAWGTSTARMYFQGSVFGTTSGEDSSEAYKTNATINSKVPHDAAQIYRVRMEIDSSNKPSNFKVFITDEKGVETEISQTGGNRFRYYSTGEIQALFLGRYGFEVTNHKISWQSGYTTAQIDYLKPDGTKLADSTTSKELPGSSKTIDTAMFTPKSEGSATYLFDADNSGWDVDGDGTVDGGDTPNTATMPAAEGKAIYRAVYKQAAFVDVAEAIETETLTGKQPILPLTVKANYEGVADPIPTEVSWDYDKFDFTTETPDAAPLEVTGTLVNGEKVTAKVHVKHAYLLADYTFDGENPAADSTGRHADADLHGVTTADIAGVDSGSNGVKLTGGSNGTSYVQLPDDLLQLTKADGAKETQDDFTLSMFINRESQGNSFAMILHATELNKPYSQGGPKGHLGLINKDTLMDMEYRIGGTTKANLTAKDENGNNIITPVGQWTHVAVVTNGTNNTAKLYLDGVLVGTVTGICKPSQLTAQNNCLGRASWDNQDYKATFDDFQVYNGILTEKEIQDIANTRLCNAPVQDVYNNLALSLKGEGTFDKDAVVGDLNLPKTMKTSDGKTVEGLKITWESNHSAVRTDGTVIQPSKGRPAAEVTLKATIQYGSSKKTKTFDIKVLPGENVSFVEFDEAFEEAKSKYVEVMANKAVYVQSTIDVLGTKLEEAKAVKDKENTNAADADEVDAMTAQLKAAMEGVKAKSLAEIGRTLLAWYSLDSSEEKVKDKSKNGKDGTAAATVTFDRDNGATFNGGAALANCITLPNDIEVGEKMTFAFWAKDSRGAKSNAFGIGSGNEFSGGAENKKAAHFFYVNTNDGNTLVASMNPSYWSGAVNISTPAAAKDTWHHIVCVLDGTKLTLYMNGRKIETKDVGHTVKEMWDSDPDTRCIYIGNCMYGKNPSNDGKDKDPDYKGSIRDFRIYNAPLAQEQVAEIYEYLKVPQMRYAKDDLIAAMTGARLEDDGTVTLNVTNLTTTDGKLNLLDTSYGADVTWKSSDNDVVNATTGVAAIPPEGDLETEKTANLTATITIGEGESQITETIVFKCKVFYALDISTDDLAQAIQAIKDEALDPDDYTQESWAALQYAISEAQKQVDRPTSTWDVEDAQSALQEARSGLVDISVLREKLGAIKSELMDLDENDYTETSWNALQDKVTAANTVLTRPDATQGEVESAIESLPDDTSMLVACGDTEALDEAIKKADALKAYSEAYTEATWEVFEAALEKAKEERAKRIEDYSEALEELNTAIHGLEIKEDHKLEGEVKAKLEGELAAAKAEALTESNYTKETWDTYQEALEAFEAVLGKEKVTRDEAEAASEALTEARAALEPVEDQIPNAEKKRELTDAYDAAVRAAEGMNPGVYTQESWQRFESALQAMKKIADRLAQEKNNVTKAEIDAAITELKAAEEALKQSVDKTALDKAIKDCGSLKAADYTAATWNAFKKALDDAKAVFAKANATQAEVNAALTTLNAKKKALKKPIKVGKIKITADYTKVAAGKKATLKANITPSDAANKAVAWSIDKTAKSKKYASISSKGVLTTNKKGAGKTVTVTATAKDGSGKKGTIKIKIMKGGVTKVSLKAKSKKVKAGKKVTIKTTVKYSGKKKSDANVKLAWKTSNKKVATVNSKGVVTAKKAGKVTITATSTDGTKKSGKIKITVTKK